MEKTMMRFAAMLMVAFMFGGCLGETDSSCPTDMMAALDPPTKVGVLDLGGDLAPPSDFAFANLLADKILPCAQDGGEGVARQFLPQVPSVPDESFGGTPGDGLKDIQNTILKAGSDCTNPKSCYYRKEHCEYTERYEARHEHQAFFEMPQGVRCGGVWETPDTQHLKDPPNWPAVASAIGCGQIVSGLDWDWMSLWFDNNAVQSLWLSVQVNVFVMFGDRNQKYDVQARIVILEKKNRPAFRGLLYAASNVDAKFLLAGLRLPLPPEGEDDFVLLMGVKPLHPFPPGVSQFQEVPMHAVMVGWDNVTTQSVRNCFLPNPCVLLDGP